MGKPNTPETFWSKIASKGVNDCWKWKGHILVSGYGGVKWKSKNVRAHRLAWELTHGKIPDGMCVLHTCDNPPCCNPNHLFIGTHQENMQDMVNKKRIIGKKGENNATSKLKNKQVKKIRTMYEKGGQTIDTLAKIFSVSRSTIHKIITRRYWTHV